MKLSTFGSYALPPVKVETLQIQGQYVQAYSQADEEDGAMPTMGTNPMVLDTATIAATFMIGRGFLKAAGYSVDEGGVDSALYDLAVNVLQGGMKTLTAIPSGGTIPKAGTATITNWTCSALASSSWDVTRHVGGGQAYCEVQLTFLVPSGLWTVATSTGTAVIPVV